jgi:hypothetical protein
VHVGGGGVPRRTAVDDSYFSPGPAEHEGRAQTGSSTTDDDDVVCVFLHSESLFHFLSTSGPYTTTDNPLRG